MGWVMKLAPVALVSLLVGCELPPIASLFLDGASFIGAGKSLSDLVLSAVAKKDCAVNNVIAGKDICHDAAAKRRPPPVFAAAWAGDDLVAKGREIFFNETFDGNGRTCGTCHRLERNFTIDPTFIATLSDDDPLFVAEFVDALKDNFENPKLMREFGLILENTNGFSDLANKFTMRGVPHLLGLPISITGIINQTEGPRTGWSGDGAPATCPQSVDQTFPDRCSDFDGSLRSFALGAVIQHFPRTLNRMPGVDFRLPTPYELNALEAFQLSLGLQQELSLPLQLTGTVPLMGQEIFLDDTLGKCNICHRNASPNAEVPTQVGMLDLGNTNFDTGVEDMTDQPADLTGAFNPPDDGRGAPGDGTFNTPSLVEAADTGPFFHDNAVQTIEGAVAFYNSDAFNNSPGGRLLASFDPDGVGIQLDAIQVVAVAAFLKVINAIFNIDQAIALLGNGTHMAITQAGHEIDDAVRVLEGGGLHGTAQAHLNKARAYLAQAYDGLSGRPGGFGSAPRDKAKVSSELYKARGDLIED